jgi:uncharacterized protein (DUF58 family)
MFGLKRQRKAARAAGEAAATPSPPLPAASAGLPNPEQLLQRLEWTVVRRLDGLLQGDYRTLFRGFGLDLAELREYQPQDDVRYIDWNVTARLQTPYVREFQEDREVAGWFLLDLSGSLDFGSQAVRKRGMSAGFVGVLARLLTRNGNRIGAVLYSADGMQTIPARSGRRHVLHVLDSMLKSKAATAQRQTDLQELLMQAQSAIKRRSVVFVVSDFISQPGWTKALAQLAQRHEVVAVRLYDPLELELPDLGMVMMQDSETGEQLFVDTHDPGFRKRFMEAAAKREADLREALSNAGVDCLELSTMDRLDAALLHFIRQRKRRGQLASGVNPLARRAGRQG